MPEQPRKHHYIPRFWLARWAAPDGRMVRYERPIPGKIVASWRYPSEVAWVKDLYRFPDDDAAGEQWLEQRVFQRIDSMAAPVLDSMLRPHPRGLEPAELSAWALLIRSLMHRTPENLRSTKAALRRIEEHLATEIRENYEELRGPGDPSTFAEYASSLHQHERERTALRLLPDLIMNRRIGTFMINMKWRIFAVDAGCPRLLMSDEPVARTDGIGNPGGHLAMPLSPSRLLVMAESDEAMRTITAIPLREMAQNMNRWTVESARRFVVAADRNQERFIRNRFGNDPKRSLTANISLIDDIAGDGDWIRRARQRRLEATYERSRSMRAP